MTYNIWVDDAKDSPAPTKAQDNLLRKCRTSNVSNAVLACIPLIGRVAA
ncbi:hypothetical protein PN499_26630 [Kamptonema animale CS-326]|nr:hypothetical protein [Kamptonema animale]MDB9514784.1 hypothetical protein [Kamptonema animale CS-326]